MGLFELYHRRRLRFLRWSLSEEGCSHKEIARDYREAVISPETFLQRASITSEKYRSIILDEAKQSWQYRVGTYLHNLVNKVLPFVPAETRK